MKQDYYSAVTLLIHMRFLSQTFMSTKDINNCVYEDSHKDKNFEI